MQNPNCKLEILRLLFCGMTEVDCNYLASALRSNPSHLRELDLSFNHPGESGLKIRSDRLEDPHCRLEKLDAKTFCFKKLFGSHSIWFTGIQGITFESRC
uniref:SPRY-associated domain-containing protein n=1 Tax=Hucho hucho TaxID=62062 RepID=A0A4W5RYQ9_9TELE